MYGENNIKFMLLAPYILFDYVNLIPTNVHSLCYLTQLFVIKKCPTCFEPIFSSSSGVYLFKLHQLYMFGTIKT